ncbi:hypothetical protein OnM2_068014 [Erysiphe neolycopersici]|uniref:DRBM domain-containing protein n=1 Tax=Erysiphe neolycopersici TaxID=212602 RepID=A0A420HLG1_9PEZI|nr:hypothetical protein OnM2_068014 [Erysiphe neolycopersici]
MDEDIEEVNQRRLISLCEKRGYGPPHYDISSVGHKHTAVVSVEFRSFRGVTCSLLCNAKESAAGRALKFYNGQRKG